MSASCRSSGSRRKAKTTAAERNQHRLQCHPGRPKGDPGPRCSRCAAGMTAGESAARNVAASLHVSDLMVRSGRRNPRSPIEVTTAALRARRFHANLEMLVMTVNPNRGRTLLNTTAAIALAAVLAAGAAGYEHTHGF